MNHIHMKLQTNFLNGCNIQKIVSISILEMQNNFFFGFALLYTQTLKLTSLSFSNKKYFFRLKIKSFSNDKSF